MRSPWQRGGDSALPGRLGRATLAALALALGVLLWTGLAGGTQPYETYEASVSSDGPVAQYRFDDAAGSSTLADSAGSYTASNSAVVLGGEGPFGGSKSGSFGGEAFATLPSDPLAGASAFSAEAWVDWAGGTTYKQPIFDLGSSSTNYLYLTPASALTNHKLLFEIRNTAGMVFQVTTTKLKANSWEYLAVTETSGGVLTLYLNGEQVAQISNVSISPSSLGTLTNDYLGKPQVAGEPFFKGTLSNVAFYNKALSATQVQDHYKAAEFPVNTAAPTITGTAKDGNTLSAKAGSWSGLTPITFTYQWTRCNASGGECVNIASATGVKDEATHEDVGKALRVAVTATNTEGSGSASSAATVPVAALKPSNLTLPVISGTAKVGQLLNVSNGTWDGSPPFTYTYEWQACSAAGTACKKIAGATASSYRVIAAQVGNTLRAIVTSANSGGSANANSAVTAVVATGEPVNTAPPTISGTPRDGQTLSASTGTWAGTEPITYAYQWQSCNSSGESCSNIAGATSATHLLGPSNVGSTLRIVVTAKNSVGSTNASSSATAVVTAIPPSNTALPTITGTAKDGQTLSASTGSWSGTPPLSYAYQWQSCNSSGESCTNISGAASSTYLLGHGDVGTTLRVVVTASNSGGSTPASSAASATVAPLAPASVTAPTISGTAEDGQTLSASTGSWSGTPPLSYAYQWQRCNSAGEGCTNIAGATGSSYVAGEGDVGTTLRVTVTATNAAGSAASQSAASAVVQARPPANATIPTISGTAQDGQTLIASTGTWSGTQPLSYAYQWQSCNALGEGCLNIAGATSSSYKLGPGEVGATLRVTLTATNSVGSASATSAASALVTAIAPSNTTPPSIAGVAQEGQTLTAATGEWSGTEPITYAYKWQSCNSSGEDCTDISGATGATYELAHGDVGSTLRVSVTATNAAGSVSATSQPTTTVGGASSGCSDTWAGGAEGSWQEAANWSSGTVPGAGNRVCVGAGVSVQLTGSAEVGSLDDQGSLRISGGSLVLSRTAASSVGGLSLSSASLNVAGELVVSVSLTTGGGSTISGAGAVVVGSAATGTIDTGSCSYLLLNGVTLTNEGTLTAGQRGGVANGSIVMEGGAKLWNAGTFNADSYDPGCGFGYGGTSFYDGDGGPSSITNTGTFLLDAGSSTIDAYIPFDNDGTVTVAGGELELSDGGIAEHVATGTWTTEGSGSIVLSGGEFLVGEAVDLSDVRIEGATVLRVPVIGAPRGSLSPQPYAAGTVTISGSGTSVGSGFAAANLELAPYGSGAWQPLCGPLTPGLNGAFACAWNTVSGAYPDGRYQVRAQLSDAESPPNVAPTPTITVFVDNTPPTGSVSAPSDIAGPTTVSGSASDSGSGVASWQLQIAPEGTGEWSNACPAQSTPASGSTYQCGLDAFSYANGAYQLRAVIDDNAGNVYTTAPAATTLDNVAPSSTVPPVISGTPEAGRRLSASVGYWAGTQPLSYSYQWSICGGEGSGCSTIAGATGSAYVPRESEIGGALRVTVTASNPLGSASSTSEATAAVSAGTRGPLAYSSLFGSLGSGEGQFNHPADIAVSATGDLFVLDRGNDRVEEFTEAGEYIRQFGSTGTGAGELNSPDGLALDSHGDVWVLDTGNSRVEEFNQEGTFVKTLGEGQVGTAEGIAVDRHDDVWVAETYAGRLGVFNDEGERLKTVGSRGSGPGQLGEPEGLAVDPEGHVLVADWANDRVEEFTEGGEYVQQIGSAGSGNGQLRTPYGIATDEVGDVWVAEVGNDRVQEFAGNGEFLSVLGAHGSEPGDLDLTFPVGLAVGAGGDMWVTDSGNSRIEEWAPQSPSAPSNTATPTISGRAQDGQTLSASTGRWGGFPQPTYTYQWQRCNSSGEDCLDIPEAKQSTYLLGHGDVEATLRVLVTATNTEGSATSSSPASEAVKALAPSNSVPPTVSGTTAEGQTLSASVGVWEGTPSLSYSYQWQRCGVLGQECVEIPGATGSTYTIVAADLGSTLRVLVTATNAVGASSTPSEATPTVAPAAPTNISAPAIAGVPVAGEAVHATTGSWGGTQPLSYAYQWQSCNAEGAECADISEATSRSYTLANSEAGKTVRVIVTAANAAGAASEASSASAVIALATAPSNTTAPSISGTAREGQTLIAAAGSWEGTPPSFSYQWQSCNPSGGECQNIEGATAATYTLAAGDLGTSLRVLVTATNAAGSAQADSAATAEVEAGPPSELDAPSITGATDAGEVLSAHPGEWGGSEVGIGYQWQSCNPSGGECQDILGATAPEYVLGEGDVGSTLRVRIMASNDQASITAVSLATAVVDAGAPTLTENLAPSISGAAQSGQSLTADPGSWTGDESVSYSYAWQRCDVDGVSCEAIAGAEGESLPLTDEDIASTIRALVTAGDANGSLTRATPVSQPVSAAGSPVLEEAPTVYGTTLDGQTLDATPGTWRAEGAPLAYTYQWERCDEAGGACAAIAGATGSSLSLGSADVGYTLKVLVTADDAEGEAKAVSSATAIVAPTQLTVVSAPSISGAAETGHPLEADAGIWTALGSIAYSYRWERCSASGESCAAIAGATQPTYTPAAADEGYTLRVTVQASDGAETATSVSGLTAVVISPDTPPENTVVPAIEGTFTVGDTISASSGSWAGAEPLSYAYQWQSCTPAGEECADIVGATEGTYVLGEGDVGASIRVLVTVTNALARTSAVSSASETVGATGPPTAGEGSGPTIYGTPAQGEKLFAANGAWSGSRPLSYLYQWQRCNDSGEACADIEAATKPSYQLQSADVGATVRVRVSVSNSLGSASAVSPQVAVTADGQPSASPSIEAAQQTDPSVLAPSSDATVAEAEIKPAIVDSGEQISAQSVLTTSTISKQTTGELALHTSAGEIALEPSGTGTAATTLPTIVNGAAAVFANSYPATDAIVRAEPLGPSTLLQLRTPQAPTTFSWQVHIGPSQRLEQLSNGSIAVVETSPESEEVGGGESEGEGGESALALGHSQLQLLASPFARSRRFEPLVEGEHGLDGHAGEREFQESLSEQGSSSSLPAAPTATTGTGSPTPGELEPSNTQHEYEAANGALETAEGQIGAGVLMVIEAPSVRDAAGNTVPATLSVTGETVTLNVSPAEGASYPVTAETAVAAPSEQAGALAQFRAFGLHADAAGAKSGARLYGLSSSYKSPEDFAESEEHEKPVKVFDRRLTDHTGKMRVSIARAIVPYNLTPGTVPWKEVEAWLGVIGKTHGLKPFITFGDPLEHYYCAETTPKECEKDRPQTDEEYANDVERVIKAFMNAPGLPPVQYWGAWNEPDLNHGSHKDLYYNAAPQAALIWRYAQAALIASGCKECFMLAGEFSEYSKYVTEFKNTIVKAQSAPVTVAGVAIKPGKPTLWGMHDYHDLVHFFEHHENTDAHEFINTLKSLNPHIWLSELGVLLEDGSALTSLQTAMSGKHHIKHVVKGKLVKETPNQLQTEAAEDYLTLGTLPDIEMLDYYQYKAHSAFDSALLNPSHTPLKPADKEPHDWREAYCVLALGDSKGCPSWVKPASRIMNWATTATTARAAAVVDPRGLPTSYWLEYGETATYGQETTHTELPNETGEQTVNMALSGLKSCTTYHYQVEAENEGNEGTPSLSGDGMFTTSCNHAVVEDPKCTTSVLPADDDESTGLITLPFSIDFYGRDYSSLYVNNNGNVTFTEKLRQWTPYVFTGATRAIIAPFLGDVDTRGGESEQGGSGGGGNGGGGGGGGGGTADLAGLLPNSVGGGGGSEGGGTKENGVSGVTSYGDTTFEGRPAFCVDWPYVGYYFKHTDKLNDFQLMLIDRSDIAAGDFEIMFNYDQVQWETGDFNGGTDGLGGTSAAAGFSNGDGNSAHAHEFAGSLVPGSFLDSNSHSGLIHGDRGSSVLGRYIFDIFDG